MKLGNLILCFAAPVLVMVLPSWKTVYAFRSPDGSTEVRVQQRACAADCNIRVIVSDGIRTQTLAQDDDCVVRSANATWNGPQVAVSVETNYCTPIRLTYSNANPA